MLVSWAHMAGRPTEIFGSSWSPSAKLEFTQPLLADAAKRGIVIVAQQHDGRIIVADVWDHVIDSFDKKEAPSWRKFCQHFITALKAL